MSDRRPKRKAKVIQFLTRLERDSNVNLNALVKKAQLMEMEGFEEVSWGDKVWKITGGRLLKQTGKNTLSVKLAFKESPKLGGNEFDNEWVNIAKALFTLRFHRDHQSTTNQRNFITAIGYVAHCANQKKVDFVKLTPEVLNNACSLISGHYKESTAYNLHKAVAEFAGHCDANKLCRILFQFKYSRMKRPSTTDGVGFKRLDDKEVLETKSDKMVDPIVFSILGELYRTVPKDHKYRFYVLVWTLFMCTGRRFSEILSLPYQELQTDINGEEFIEYFPKKISKGNTFTPKRPLYVADQVLEIVRDAITEINTLCAPARDTAQYIFDNGDVDLRFLENISENKWLYREDLGDLGLSPRLMDAPSWIRENNFIHIDNNFFVEERNAIRKKPYTLKEGLISYCKQGFVDTSHNPIHIDQSSKEYYLKDMMFVRHQGLSSGYYARWLATECTHAMMTTNMRYLSDLSEEFTTTVLDVNFTTHSFRHTLNTLLDEGGLSDIMQTEWFARTNPNDTKAYQHTSREKRALMIREDIKKGTIKGMLSDEIKLFPTTQQDAILKARIKASQDVGPGICIHDFSQIPCERQLSCSADCKDYLWVENDEGRLEELKRKYSVTSLARDFALEKSKSSKPKKSVDWLVHNDKELKTLSHQLHDNGIDVKTFNPQEYMDKFIKGD